MNNSRQQLDAVSELKFQVFAASNSLSLTAADINKLQRVFDFMLRYAVCINVISAAVTSTDKQYNLCWQ